MMSGTSTVIMPTKQAQGGTRLDFEPLYQVVLWNDDVHSMPEVMNALQCTFGHTRELATKIMLEAHQNGKSIAEVESKDQAQLHKEQLQGYTPPFTVDIEAI